MSLFSRKLSYASTLLSSGVRTETLHTDTLSTAGDFTWTCPAGVTVANVAVLAGCGGGGDTDDVDNGGGGGGGALVTARYTVTAGDYAGHVGAGGAAGDDGADSSFDGANVVAAKGLGGDDASSGPGSGGGGGTGSTVPAGGFEAVGNSGAAGNVSSGIGGSSGSGLTFGGDGGVAGGAAPTAGDDGSVTISYALPATGDAVAIRDGQAVQFVLDVTTGGADSSDWLDVVVQTKDGEVWTDVLRFTRVTGDAPVKRHVAKVTGVAAMTMYETGTLLAAGAQRNIIGDQWRISHTVTSGNAATFTFSVTAIPIPAPFVS